MSLAASLSALVLAGLMLSLPAAAEDRALLVTRKQVQDSFDDLIRFELLVSIGVKVPDSQDPESQLYPKVVKMRRHEAVNLGNEVLGVLWPYTFSVNNPPKDDEPPISSLMFPQKAKDLDDCLRTGDWPKFYQQYVRMMGSLDGQDPDLRSPAIMYASLLEKNEYEGMAQRLQRELGGDLANWNKVVPIARNSIVRLASRATGSMLAYAQKSELKALGKLKSNGLEKLTAGLAKTEKSALRAQFIGYNFWSCVRYFPDRAGTFPKDDYFNIFYAMFTETTLTKKKMDADLRKYFPD